MRQGDRAGEGLVRLPASVSVMPGGEADPCALRERALDQNRPPSPSWSGNSAPESTGGAGVGAGEAGVGAGVGVLWSARMLVLVFIVSM
jgi:hypothetical protein